MDHHTAFSMFYIFVLQHDLSCNAASLSWRVMISIKGICHFNIDHRIAFSMFYIFVLQHDLSRNAASLSWRVMISI